MLDVGALIAGSRGSAMIAVLLRALAQGRTADVVGQAWRDGRRQVTLPRFLRSEEVDIVPLDEQLARACGRTLQGPPIRMRRQYPAAQIPA